MLPGSGAGPFTGQSESRSLPASRNAACRAPAVGPMSPRPGDRRGVSRACRRVVSRGARGSGVARAAARAGSGAGRGGSVSATGARRAAAVESTAGGAGRAESRAATGTGAGAGSAVPVLGALRAHASAKHAAARAWRSPWLRKVDRGCVRIGIISGPSKEDDAQDGRRRHERATARVRASRWRTPAPASNRARPLHPRRDGPPRSPEESP